MNLLPIPQPECRLKYQQQQRMNRRNVNEVIMNGGAVLEVNQNWGRKFSYFKSYLQLNTPVNYHHETIKNMPTLECSLAVFSVKEKWERILSVSQGYFGVFCSVDGWGHYKLWIIYDASLLKEFKTEHANADDERESWAEQRRVHFHSTAEKSEKNFVVLPIVKVRQEFFCNLHHLPTVLNSVRACAVQSK